MEIIEKPTNNLSLFYFQQPLSALIKDELEEAYELKKTLLADALYVEKIRDICEICIEAYQKKHKILIAGNGGSAADAIHFGGELHGRYFIDRPPLPVRVLNSDLASLTAIANDYGYEYVFSRQVEAEGEPGDVFIGISTSGNSSNILRTVEICQKQGIKTVGLTGGKGLSLFQNVDHCLMVPSVSTPRIQECHGFILHTICLTIEKAMFS